MKDTQLIQEAIRGLNDLTLPSNEKVKFARLEQENRWDWYDALIAALEEASRENERLRESLKQIATEPTTKFRFGDSTYWANNARNIARKALGIADGEVSRDVPKRCD